MDERFYKEILEDNKDAVRQKVKEAMLASVQREFEWELPQAIKEEVNQFIKEEIAPAIREKLSEDKDAMVRAATDMISGIPVELGKAMQASVAEKLTNSWQLRKITDALFS